MQSPNQDVLDKINLAKKTGAKLLDLSNCQLTEILENISTLSNLTELNLNNNQLTEIPESISALSNLTRLYLSDNQLTEISENITALSNLTALYLSGNQLTEIPENISALSNLTTLPLNGNQLTEIPEAISALSNLTHLYLGGNQLTEIPEAISVLSNLTVLYLNRNQLTGIPEAISVLSNLTTLYLDDNPILTPPKDIVSQGISAIRTYFEAKAFRLLYEAKLLLVGEPGAGKTSLRKKLQKPDYPIPNTEEESTLGVEIEAGWTFPCTIKKETLFSANLWDFGGQQIQDMTHQFFLTSRSLYVLVSDDREQRTNFDYWFNIITLLGGGSPVLVVLNEKNHKSISNFDLVATRKNFEGLCIEKFDVDLSKKDGRPEALRQKICEMLSTLKHVGDKLPAQWIPIRKVLENQKDKNHIPISEYFEICKKEGVVKQEAQLVLSTYLHDLGILLHFKDDPALCDMMILNPQWAMDAVYTALSSKHLISNGGRFSKSWLFDLWAEKGYSFEEQRKLLLLMLKNSFELCYALADSDGETFIAPQHLPEIKPEFKWDEKDNLRFRLQYPFMPQGIMTRLIVQLNRLIDSENTQDLVWKNGVVFKRDGVRALLIQEKTKKEGLKVINIQVSGPPHKKKVLLSTLRDKIREIHEKSFKNIVVNQMIPCNCEGCIVSETPHFFSAEELENYVEKGKAEITCKNSVIDVSIRRLVEGIAEDQKSFEKRGLEGREEHIRVDVVERILRATPPARATASANATATATVNISIEIKNEINGLSGAIENLEKRVFNIIEVDSDKEEAAKELSYCREALAKIQQATTKEDLQQSRPMVWPSRCAFSLFERIKALKMRGAAPHPAMGLMRRSPFGFPRRREFPWPPDGRMLRTA